jgi:hypothetical protein
MALSPFTVRLSLERVRIDKLAGAAMTLPVRTVTASRSERSEGGIHDFYSEGDYWWPDPDNPEGPYIRRDGESNPGNFNDHREALMAFSDAAGTLATAYLLTGEQKYAHRLSEHLHAWFVSEESHMNPSLLFAQAIKGRTTGRSIGIIDTVHLAEVALAAHHLAQRNALSQQTLDGTVHWFRSYLGWLNTHAFGIREKEHPNNHSVAWSLQAAAFATLVGDKKLLAEIRQMYRNIYVKTMMDQDGSFPAELARTKPYGYSLFMLDLMAGIAALASTESENLWQTDLGDGRSIRNMFAFMVPYIKNKEGWPLPEDVQYWESWPAQHAALVLGAIAFDEPAYAELWQTLDTRRDVFEVMRNLPMRNVLLWLPR